MRVMGIDQSFTSSGIVILENDNIIYSQCYKTDKKHNCFKRAYMVMSHIAVLIKEHTPDIIAIEGLAFAMRGNVTRDLAGLQFVIITHLQEAMHKDVNVIAPLTVKKFATGSGKASKEEMISSLPDDILNIFLSTGVKKTTGLADLTDAFWIAKIAKQNKEKE